MRDIVLIHSTLSKEIPTLCVSQIHYLPLYEALVAHNLPPHNPKAYTDVLVFTSKHAVTALTREIHKHKELQAFLEIPTFAIGDGCARTLEQAGFFVEFISTTKHGSSFAQEIIQHSNNRRLLYLRAQEIVSNLDTILLQAGIQLIQLTAYVNSPKRLPASLKPKPQSILIFTSPSNYRFFIQNFGWDSSYIAVTMGQTTLHALAPDTTSYASPTQTLESCIHLAKKLAQEY